MASFAAQFVRFNPRDYQIGGRFNPIITPLPLPLPRPSPPKLPAPVPAKPVNQVANFSEVMQDRNISFTGPSPGASLPVFTPEFLTNELENFKMQTENGFDMILEISAQPPPPVFTGFAPSPILPPIIYTPPKFFYAAAAG